MKLAFQCIIASTFVLLIGVACSNSRPDTAGSGATAKEKSKKDGSDDDSGDQSSGSKNSADGSTGSDQANSQNSLNGATGSATMGENPDDPLAGCGGASFTQAIDSANVPYKGQAGRVFSTDFTVVVKGAINFSGSPASLTTQSMFELISADPNNAAERARNELNKVTGSRQVNLAMDSTLPCGILAASRLVEQTGEHATTIDFNPPVAYLISPKTTTNRFAEHFATARTFDNIKLTVTSTTNEKLQPGTSVDGSVSITPVPSKTTFNDTSGRNITIDADYAYRIDFNFGDHETVNNFGLSKVATYYIKDGNFKVITIETGVNEAPVINYITN